MCLFILEVLCECPSLPPLANFFSHNLQTTDELSLSSIVKKFQTTLFCCKRAMTELKFKPPSTTTGREALNPQTDCATSVRECPAVHAHMYTDNRVAGCTTRLQHSAAPSCFPLFFLGSRQL